MRFKERFNYGNTYLQLKKIIYFIKLSKINLWFIPLSIFLSVTHTMLAAYGISLLFPLVHGILAEDFSNVQNIKGIRFVVRYFPEFFLVFGSPFVFLLFWLYLVNLIKNVFSYFSSLVAKVQSKRSTARIRGMLLESFLSFGKDFYDKKQTTQLQDILINSSGLVHTQIKTFQDLITKVLLTTTYAVMMLMISWKLMIITVILLPFIIFVNRKLSKNIVQITEVERKHSVNLKNWTFNMLHCMPVIKSFGQEKKEMNVFHAMNDEEMEAGQKIEKLKGLMDPINDVGVMTGNICIALAMAALMKYDHGLTAANAFIFYYLTTRMMPGLNSISRFSMEVERISLALDEMEEILLDRDKYTVPSGAKQLINFEEKIEFKNLSFKYSDRDQLILNNINFTIEKKSILAITGVSGSGKTTILNLLLRFYDCPPNQLFIDNQDIRTYNIESLRKQITVVGQDSLLFNDTIRNNIIYGLDRPIGDQELDEFMKSLNLKTFINKFPDKYETVVGEKGTRLSGGERQRIAIARAVIKDSPILILDEATSSLDAQTESSIMEGICGMYPNKTIIIVAHRFSTIRKADKIIYLEKGSIAESGTWEELIDQQGLFYKQYAAQNIQKK